MKEIQRSMKRGAAALAVALLAACGAQTDRGVTPAAEHPSAQEPALDRTAPRERRPPDGLHVPRQGPELEMPAAPLFDEPLPPAEQRRSAAPQVWVA